MARPPKDTPPALPPTVPAAPPALPVEALGGIGRDAAPVDAAATAAQASMQAAEDAAIARAAADRQAAEDLDPDGHDLHAILTNKQVLAVRAQARKEMLADQVAAAKASLLDEEKQRLLVEEGVSTGSSALDEIVSITLDLADHTDKLVVNFAPYWHGITYTVPRHVANSLREQMWRGWQHQHILDGKGIAESYQRQRVSSISPKHGIKNAPRTPDMLI